MCVCVCVCSECFTNWLSPISFPLLRPAYSLRHKTIEIGPINNPTMAYKCQEGSSVSHFKSKVRDIISHQSEWPSSKNLQTINAGEGVEKRESSYSVSGNVNWYYHYGEHYGGSLKT